MMDNRINEHLLYYASLIMILGLGFYFVYSSAPDRQLQLMGVFVTSSIYAIWGIMHHAINHSLVAKIMVEYVLIAALGIAIAFFILKGGFGV